MDEPDPVPADPAAPQVEAHLPPGVTRGPETVRAFRQVLGNTLVAKDVRAAFEQALGKLKDLGAELVELQDDLPNMEPIWKVGFQSLAVRII